MEKEKKDIKEIKSVEELKNTEEFKKLEDFSKENENIWISLILLLLLGNLREEPTKQIVINM